MSIRDDLIPLVDELREDVIDGVAGLRIHTVVVRSRSWSGGAPGSGTATDTDVTLAPVPKVHEPEPRLRLAAPGKYEDGDRVVDRISLTYTRAQLDGGAVGADSELLWLVDGEPYRVISVEERYLEWRVHLRRMRARP